MALHFSHRIDKKNLEYVYALTIVIFLVLISIKSKEATSTFGLLDTPDEAQYASSTITFSFGPIPANDTIERVTSTPHFSQIISL
jgi:hypothetical protein